MLPGLMNNMEWKGRNTSYCVLEILRALVQRPGAAQAVGMRSREKINFCRQDTDFEQSLNSVTLILLSPQNSTNLCFKTSILTHTSHTRTQEAKASVDSQKSASTVYSEWVLSQPGLYNKFLHNNKHTLIDSQANTWHHYKIQERTWSYKMSN